jgi:hypothetical protein
VNGVSDEVSWGQILLCLCCQASRRSPNLLRATPSNNAPTGCASTRPRRLACFFCIEEYAARRSSGRMVRLKMYARIIPEEVYLDNLTSPTPMPKGLPLPEEKKLLHPVDDPRAISVGILANEIKERFQRMNHWWVCSELPPLARIAANSPNVKPSWTHQIP